MRFVLVAAALTAAAAILAGAVGGATQHVDQIAFTNNQSIYVIGADGKGLRRVTRTTKFSDGGVAWSADGKLLAFSRFIQQVGCGENQGRGDLFVVGADGTGEHSITHTGCMFVSPSSVAWSPRGHTLAFDDDAGIVLAQGPSWKTRVVSANGLFPSWSADGRRLVYNDGPEVRVVDVATRKSRKISTGADYAVWSHNGRTIAYVARSGGLGILSSSGGSRRTLVTLQHLSGPTWSPDDRKLAFSTYDTSTKSTAWVIAVSGGKPVKLGPGSAVAWAPGGKQLSVEAADGSIYLVRPDGSGRHRLTKGFGAAWKPAA